MYPFFLFDQTLSKLLHHDSFDRGLIHLFPFGSLNIGGFPCLSNSSLILLGGFLSSCHPISAARWRASLFVSFFKNKGYQPWKKSNTYYNFVIGNNPCTCRKNSRKEVMHPYIVFGHNIIMMPPNMQIIHL